MNLETNQLVKKAKTTEIEIFVINKVKEYRIKLGYKKRQLSLELRLAHNHVYKIENPKYTTKYNLNQLNELAKIFGCTIADFMPKPYVETDTIEEYMELHPRIKAKYEQQQRELDEKMRKKEEEKERKKKEKAAAKPKTKAKKK